jgi:photosystem II stability/assembly factor-like uncharacterized protein
MRLLPITVLCLSMNFLHIEIAVDFLTDASNNSHVATIATNTVEPVATNILYQSKDGGQTWEDVSYSLPSNTQPEGFFAGASDLYMRINNTMYRSNSNLNSPIWEEVQGLDRETNSISFNHSAVMAYNYEGTVYQRKYSTKTWTPAYTDFKKSTMRTIFEAANGTLFLGRDNGLYKSTDKGQNWRRVQDEGWVINLVEADGVLIGTGTKGIMRSTDNGEHWDWVISEGGVGIAVEKIEGGFAAITFNTTTQSRRIRISMDAGKAWQPIDAGLQPSFTVTSIKQVGNYLLCAHPDGIFRSSDRGKTWKMVHEGVEKQKNKIPNMLNTNPLVDDRKVFALFVSGSLVYAVAQEGGC